MQSKLFAQVLSEGVQSMKAYQHRNIEAIEGDIATALGYDIENVRRWHYKGYVPTDEHVEFLARYIMQNSQCDRGWLNRFLTHARYYDRQRLLDELCPKQPTLSLANEIILHNLPPRSGEFLGRQEEMAQVIDGLASPRWPIISIEGMGGIGKTTLGIEVARACLPDGTAGLNEPFEACVYISAKKRPVVLNDLLDTIARVLNYPYIIQQTPPTEKPTEVDRLLQARRVLIFADCFEEMTDQSLVDYLRRIPEPSKALVTTRYGQFRRVFDVPLKGLPDKQALELIRHLGRRLGLPAITQAEDQSLKPLVEVTGGNPYALITALGYLKYGGLALDRLVNALHKAGREVSEIFDYIFNGAWDVLRPEARHLLMVIPFFVESASKTALAATAGVEDYYLDTALRQLVEMSLLDGNGALEEAKQRYSVHPLTRAFAGKKLRELSDQGMRLREQWIDWCLQFGNTNGASWQTYDLLEDGRQNLIECVEWCFQAERWQHVITLESALTQFLKVRGHLGDRERIGRRALQAAKTLGDEKLYAEVIVRTMISALEHLHRDDERDKLCREALAIFERHGDRRGLATATYRLGTIDFYLEDKGYSVARPLLDASLKMWEELGDEESIAQVLDFIGLVSLSGKRWDEAKKFLERAWVYEKEQDRPHRQGRVLYNLGRIEIQVGDPHEAEKFFTEALELFQREAHQEHIADALCELAYIKCIKGEVEDALQILYKAKDLCRGIDTWPRIGPIVRAIYCLEQKRGNVSAVRPMVEEMIDQYRRLEMPKERQAMEKLLSEGCSEMDSGNLLQQGEHS